MMTARGKEVSRRLRLELLRRAGEQCAICHRKLRLDDEETGKSTFIADIAHIYPMRVGGERGDPQGPADLNDPSNLIPLCPFCHRVVDSRDTGGRYWPVSRLRTYKSEHEAWIALWKERPAGQTVTVQESAKGLAPGSQIIVDRQSFWLPADPRLDRIDGYFSRQRSPDGAAERHVCYAYAEAGAASHVWVRRVAASAESVIGARWRAELTDEAALLATRLRRIPGLPRLLAEEIRPGAVSVVTELPAVTTLRDRFGVGGPAAEAVRALFAGLAPLCEALRALHDSALAHGNLDSASILVNRRGDLALRDLGLATASRTGDPPVTAADDVQTLARIIYELVTGFAPLTGAQGPPVLASALNPQVPEPAAQVLAQGLARNLPDARVFAKKLTAGGQARR